MKPEDLKSPFKWEARLVLLQDRIWFVPNYYDQYEMFTFPGWEHPDLFGNTNPVCVEYCSGNGAWIAAKAQENPHLNWIGIEKQFARARKIWSKIKNLNLPNLVVVCGEAHTVTNHYFPENSVSQVYINFPDPWPKLRHAKHRIIQTKFVNEVHRILKNDGTLTLVTDDADFSEWSIDVLKQHVGFTNDHPAPFYRTDYNDYGSSFFEQLWREKGRTIRHHQFRKQKAAVPVTISINARVNSDLDWRASRREALDAMMNGSKILWKLDLGLFAELANSLSNQTQFLSLSLALEHFRDTFWKEFESHTLGIMLYDGHANFTKDFIWNKEQTENFQIWLQDRFENIECLNQELGLKLANFADATPYLFEENLLPIFCRDVSAEYLLMLANRMPDGMPLCIQLEASQLTPLLQAQVLNREAFGRLELLINGSFLTHSTGQKYAICLPPLEKCRPSHYQGMEKALNNLIDKKIPFKLIPEEKLITEWDELDYVFYSPGGLSSQGKRKLQGFCAAGGTVISLQEKIGLANESLLEELFE